MVVTCLHMKFGYYYFVRSVSLLRHFGNSKFEIPEFEYSNSPRGWKRLGGAQDTPSTGLEQFMSAYTVFHHISICRIFIGQTWQKKSRRG